MRKDRLVSESNFELIAGCFLLLLLLPNVEWSSVLDDLLICNLYSCLGYYGRPLGEHDCLVYVTRLYALCFAITCLRFVDNRLDCIGGRHLPGSNYRCFMGVFDCIATGRGDVCAMGCRNSFRAEAAGGFAHSMYHCHDSL